MSDSSRQIASIMFTDIVGYTALMGSDESKAFAILQQNRDLHKPIIAEYNGRLIKELGDGMLVSFSTVTDAVLAALKIQYTCRQANNFQLRIGIHVGEVVFENDDVFGDGVNIASRLQSVAEPGHVYISEMVRNNVFNKTGIVTRFVRQEKLKNIQEPLNIYEVLAAASKEVRSHGTIVRPNIKRAVRWVVGALVLVLLGIASAKYWQPKGAVANLEKSIAVLPLSNLSADTENQFFADGLVEDMLTRLASIESFKVISRTSSEMYRDKGSKSIPQIGRELGVSYIVEGSVQRVAGKARINIQLIEAGSDTHIWAKNFDRDLEDIFQIQTEVATLIAAELNSLLTSEETANIQHNRTSNIKAFELYQLGRFHWSKRTVEGYKTSLTYFEQAIADDPGYGLAYAGLADSYNLMALQGHMDKKEGRDKAVILANKALELDDRLAEAHNVLASVYTYVDMNWDEAEKEYLKAIEINPNYATAHHYYSEYLSMVGRHEEARAHIDQAVALDPLSFVIHFVSQKLHFHRGSFAEALIENRRCHELNDSHPWLIDYDFDINYHLKNEQVALAAFKKMEANLGSSRIDSAYESSGLNGLLWLYLSTNPPAFPTATIYGYLGEDEKAMEYLEEAFEKDELWTGPEFVFEYAFRNLRSKPKFQAMLRSMNLPAE